MLHAFRCGHVAALFARARDGDLLGLISYPATQTWRERGAGEDHRCRRGAL
jgi:hypothetical protein